MNTSIPALAAKLTDEAVAYEFLEGLRWKGEPVCPHCGTKNARHYFLKPSNGMSRATRTGTQSQRRVWKCRDCRKQFSVLTGTIFHGSKMNVVSETSIGWHLRRAGPPSPPGCRRGVTTRCGVLTTEATLVNIKTMPIKRITHSLLLVIEAMLAESEDEHWGYALAKATGLAPATVQPILTRLEESKLVVARWEDIDPSAEGRRPRRLYRINGAAAALELSRTLAEHQRRLRPAQGFQPGQVTT